jgi:hypothetical protein
MRSFRLLCLGALFTIALSVPALADGGITQAPGAPSPGDMGGPSSFANPGETQTPPCAPGDMGTPPCMAAYQQTQSFAATRGIDNPALGERGIIDTPPFASLVFALRSWIF